MATEDVTLPDGSIADTFQRNRASDGKTVNMQAVVLVDPIAGDPLQLAQQATLVALNDAVATLNVAAAAIKSAVEALNGKTTAVDTGNVAIATLPATAAKDVTLQAISDLNDTMLYWLPAIVEKMPRLNKTDMLVVDIGETGLNSLYTDQVINAVCNRYSGLTFYRMFEPWNFSDAGCARLYNNVTVS